MAGQLNPRKLHPCFPYPLTRAGGLATQRQLKIESKNKLLSGVWRRAQQVGVGPGPWGASAGCRGENQHPELPGTGLLKGVPGSLTRCEPHPLGSRAAGSSHLGLCFFANTGPAEAI